MLKFRWYYDKDAEEIWLRKMSQRGWAFKKFFLGFYTFEASAPGEYNYQIDLLDNWRGDKEDFTSFMEGSGVEVISQWYRWVYLQKKTADGPFEMYTDAASKIAQYNRIKKLFQVALILEIICLCFEIKATVTLGEELFYYFDITLGILVLIFLRMVWKCKWKIEQLKRESN